MNVKQHIRMTASEIAMGRYMRAPDHSAADASFDTAFAEFASPEDKKPGEAGAAGAIGGDAAAGGEGDGSGAGAASGDGSGGAAGGSGDGSGAAADGAADAGAGGGEAAAAAVDGDAGAQGAAADDAGAGAAKSAAGDAGGVAGADAGAGAAAAAGAADAGAAADSLASAGPDADAILAGLKKLVGQPAEVVAVGDAGAGAAAVVEEKPIYTADEQTKLAKYEEDWKDVSEGEALKRRAEYSQLLQHIFTQVANFVKPIQETADALAQRTFTSDVKTAVPDYSDQLRSDVVAWAKLQPTYLQVAYNHVIEEGTVDEVKDLVDRYRTATGKAASKPAGAGGAASKTTDDKGNELSDEAKKAAAKLAPVDSKRSGVQAPSDPSDFEDAWKQAAADLG